MKALCIYLLFICYQAFAAPIEVDLDGQFYLTSGAGFVPPQDSRVTYKLGNKVLHHDGYIYENGHRTERMWSILSPGVVEMFHQHQQLSEEWDSEVIINLNSSTPNILIKDYPNQNLKVDITSSIWRRARAQGYTMTPEKDQVTFTHKGFEYRPDGKVYKDGKPTGENWGVPLVSSEYRGGLGHVIGDFLNGVVGQSAGKAYKMIVTYQKYLSEKNEWDRYIESRRRQAQELVNQVVSYNDFYANAIKGHVDKINKNTNKIVSELDAHFGKVAAHLNADATILNIEPIRPEDYEFSHVRYIYQYERFENLANSGEQAIHLKDYKHLERIIDLTLNSGHGLPERLKKYTLDDGILLPEKVNPSLGTSPLAHMSPNWDQSTHLGQVATRTANKLQSSWALHDGLKYSPTVAALKHLTSYSLFRKGVELLPWSAHDSLLYFKLSSMVLDMGVGASVGFYKALEELVEGLPSAVSGAMDFIYKAYTEEDYLDEAFIQFIENIPAIKQAIWKGILESWDTLNHGTPYEKGSIIGGIALHAATDYVAGGAIALATRSVRGANWYKEANQATRQLYDSLRGLRRSSAWLNQHNKHFERVQHWVSYVDTKTIQFHSPAHPKSGPLDYKFLTENIKYNEKGLPISGQRVAETFNAGTYMSYVTNKPITLFRVYTHDDYIKGSFLTDIPPIGPAQATSDLALHPAYKNRALKWAVIEVPPNTRVFEGNVAPQVGMKYEVLDAMGKTKDVIGMGNLKGMGRQYYIDSKDLDRLKIKNYGPF